ncbi:PD-(D/E)XK motif protein, partial [Chloroflexota bacterium]
PNHGETLPEIVQSVRSVVSELDCLPVFEERLILCGYKDEDAESYSKVGYTIRSRKQFGISPDFPRITPSDLMPGVSEVSYSITVTACSQYEINDTELINLLKEGS